MENKIDQDKPASSRTLELIVLVGFQGAGKTTFALQRFAGTHVLISKDRLRNNPHPERRQQLLVAAALAAGHSVVVDNTNPSVAERGALIARAREAGARVIGYLFASSLEACRIRNASRSGRDRVPDVGIFSTVKRFEPPSLSEGFDELWFVETLPELCFEVRP